MTTLYKIVNDSGKFSTGGYKPKWNNKGKSWHRTCDISNHIQQLALGALSNYAAMNARVVELKVEESPVKAMTIAEWQQGMKERKNARVNGKGVRKEVRQIKTVIQQKTAEVVTLKERLQNLLKIRL